MAYYFTSDTHHGDERLNLFGRDGAFKSAKECDEYIIKKWNEIVKEDDIIFHLGDVAMTKEGLDLVKQLNGIKYLIKGNYDKADQTAKYEVSDELLLEYFDKVEEYFALKITLEDGSTEEIFLVHEPEKAREDMFNLVGHIHGLWKVQRNKINVGTDAWHFMPVSLDQVKFYINAIRKYYDINVYAGELPANLCKSDNFEKNENE